MSVQRWSVWLLAAVGGALCGCAASRPSGAPTMRVDAGEYAQAFQSAKDMLRDAGFELDRVDARHGVITTYPRASAGLATPWFGHARTLGGAVDDFIHNQARAVAVEFTPGATDPPSDDLRRAEGPIEISVIAEILRAERTGRRVDSTMPRRSTFTVDPVAARAGENPASIRAIRRDPPLEMWLADRLAAQLRHQDD